VKDMDKLKLLVHSNTLPAVADYYILL
jgi:hypothetical protein